MPIFKGIYKELHGTLPAPTLILVTISDITVKFFPIVLVLVVLGVVGFRYFIKTPNGRVLWDTTKLKAPVFGQLAGRPHYHASRLPSRPC